MKKQGFSKKVIFKLGPKIWEDASYANNGASQAEESRSTGPEARKSLMHRKPQGLGCSE